MIEEYKKTGHYKNKIENLKINKLMGRIKKKAKGPNPLSCKMKKSYYENKNKLKKTEHNENKTNEENHRNNINNENDIDNKKLSGFIENNENINTQSSDFLKKKRKRKRKNKNQN